MASKPSDLSMRRPTRPNQHRLSFVDFRGNARYVIRGMRVNSTGSSNRGEPSKIPDGNVLSGRYRAENETMMCSVIVPVYNERDNVRAVYQALCGVAARAPSLDWEFLFVED